MAAALILLGIWITAVGPLLGTPAGAGASGSLDLVDQVVDVGAEDPWWARVRASGTAGQPTVVATVFAALPNRLAYLQTTQGGTLGAPIARLGPAEVDSDGGVVRVTLDADARTGARMVGPAVHPLLVSLLGENGEPLDELLTYIVLTDTAAILSTGSRGAEPTPEPADPMPVSLVLPLRLDPRIAPDGSSQLSRRDEQQLGVIVDALNSHRRTPVTVDVNAETVVALLESGRPSAADLVAGLAAALTDREVLARPFVRLQPTAWFANDMEVDFSRQLDAGAATLLDATGATTSGEVWLGDPTLDAAAVDALIGLGFTRFALPDLTSRSGLFEISGLNAPHQATAIDSRLAGHIGSTGDPVLDAHRVLADLAVIAGEAPGKASAVIVPPEDWAPSDPFLNALLDGLEDSSTVSPRSLTDLFEDRPGTNGAIALEAEPADPLGNYPERLSEVATEVDGLASVLPDANELVDSQRTVLLTSGSADLSIFEREAYLTTVSQTVNTLRPVIQAPEGRRVTMTGRTGVIPVGLDNQSGRPVRVAVELRSNKLDFPEGSVVETELAEGLNQLEIPVKARTSGDSTLELVVLSPDRSLELHSTSVTVRSTALSGVGLIIAAVALLILLIWWIRNFRTGRRDGRLVPDAPDATDGPALKD